MSSLRNLRVLVTGATGFLGAEIVCQLLAEGAQVTATGRDAAKGRALESTGAHFVSADLADSAAAIALCTGQDAVIHCAASCSPWPSLWLESETHRQANVASTAHVLQGCVAGRVRRLVHISTPSLYPTAEGRALPEWMALEPPSRQPTQYAATKLQAEALVANEVRLYVLHV